MIVGTAGHIDHGKTALVRALTGVDTDRLKEEKARGISIDLGFAYLPTDDGTVLGFVDVPGHEKFVRNMLAGATGIDFVLLVVAADDGVMPQTREHLAIVDLLGVDRGIVALSKADLAAPAQRQELTHEIFDLLQGTRLAKFEIVPVSTATGEGVGELRSKLFAAAHDLGRDTAHGRFRLAVDRSFSLTGVGTVVTGTVLSGTVEIGAVVRVSPSGLTARVRSIHAQNRPAQHARAGERCALNLTGEGISKQSIRRGDVVLDPALHAPSERIDAAFRALATEPKPIGHWMPVRLHHAAAEVEARLVLLEDGVIHPGGAGRIQLVLSRPIAAAVGDRYVLRDTSGLRTIGGGTFLDLRAPARRRSRPERLAQLDALALADPQQSLAALTGRWPCYVDLAAFARDHALTTLEVDEITDRLSLARVATPNATFALSAEIWRDLKRNVIAVLEAFHAGLPDAPGLSTERLRQQVEPKLPAPVFLNAMQALARTRDVVIESGAIRLPGHQFTLAEADRELWAKISAKISSADRFRPPRGRELADLLRTKETDVRRVLKLLGRRGDVVEISPDHFFLRETVAEMVDIAVDIAANAPDGQFTAAQFRDRMDNGRKVAIQILEFFDRHGVTVRRGDLRRMNTQRLGLFRRGSEASSTATTLGGESSPVGRPDFKSGRGRQPVLGGFDTHSLPPRPRS